MNRAEIVMLSSAIISIVLMFAMIFAAKPLPYGLLAVVCAAVAASIAIRTGKER